MPEFIKNFPFFCIVLSLLSSVICYAIRNKKARFVTYGLLVAGMAMSVTVIIYNLTVDPGYFVYRMGHYDAPIGNEISAGLLEPFFVFLFETVILLSITGGAKRIFAEVDESKHKIFYVMVNLTHAALCALCYTNDIFTAYVFVEICTIASCALLMSKSSPRALVAATRYMIFSLIGSGLLLIGIILLYSVTGQLLFPQLYENVQQLWTNGEYTLPLTVALGLLVAGLAIKSGLCPFHMWMPDTYGTATPAASGILSGVISKGYLFLLLKVIYRVIGVEMFTQSHIGDILFVFGICGMIFGSVSAIRTNNINFMIAFSSAAQIGYIYMGLGLGSTEALIASLFQIAAHALTKPMLFLAASGLSDTVKGKKDFASLCSSAHRNKISGLAFAAGALSMVGIPVFTGFVPKLLFATSAFGHSYKTYFVLIALALSTTLNVVYFLRTLINVYSVPKVDIPRKTISFRKSPVQDIVLIIMIAVNVYVGLHSQPLISLFENGIEIFMNIR